ncbi:flagellar basal body P-ring biosynthesis protein FlgA [Streptomyces acidiscabies]|uniref:Flagellar basal body P-ring biosynthesis protein FlgA n=2 Tax=Streptomyces acidiscabies TaxID=42234 RepID=A0A0L0JDZ8_9ACTN|nr:flagellar basal body P-ring biosynthesis protein FlgA [Streptomyces acidiscabies]
MTGMPRPRRLPYLLVGVLLVVGCTAGGVVVATQTGDREPVLVLARPVTVGQVLSGRDLREESVAAEGLALVPVRSRSAVVGRPVAYSLPAGTPLTKNALGPANIPPAGQAVAAVALKAGQFPPGVRPGSRVSVVQIPAQDASSSSPTTWSATVTDVRGDDTGQTTVLSLLMPQTDAHELAAAPPGQLGVVTEHGDGP